MCVQVCAWLSESAEMFLQQHTDTGTSLEMAEDLLAEHQEFHIRAEVHTWSSTLLTAPSLLPARTYVQSSRVMELVLVSVCV